MQQRPGVRRITVFVEHFPPYLGSDRSVFELGRRAADRGISIQFIATQPLRYLLGGRPPDWKYKKRWSQPPPKVHPNITAHYLITGKNIESVWKRNRYLALLLTILLFTAYSIRPIIRHSSDLVVAAHATPLLGVVAMLAAKLTRRRLLMGCPDWMSAYAAGLLGTSLHSLGPRLLHILEVRLYKWSDRVFTVTHFLRRLLIHAGVSPDKIAVIPNGVDPKMFSPEVDTSAVKRKYRLEDLRVILFSGHLEEWAGLSLIYDLARRLDKEYPDSRILLVGSGESIVELFDRLVRRNLGHMLIHAGLHPYEAMPVFTAAADIALCIFPDTPVAHAASPLKIFEYMAAGTAVVATAVAGTLEALSEGGGILVPPNDSEALCDAVIRLCRDDRLREDLSRKAREVVEQRYSWDQLAERFLEECDRCVGLHTASTTQRSAT